MLCLELRSKQQQHFWIVEHIQENRRYRYIVRSTPFSWSYLQSVVRRAIPNLYIWLPKIIFLSLVLKKKLKHDTLMFMHKSAHDLKFSFLLVTEEKPRKISIVVCKYFENHPEKQLNKNEFERTNQENCRLD